MSRYLRLSKPAPAARCFELDYAGWYARLAGSNGGAKPAPPAPVAIARPARPDAERPAA